MRRVLSVLVAVCVLSISVQAAYVDVSPDNTELADGSGDPWYTTTGEANLWYQRVGAWANDDAGVYGVEGDVFESRDDTVGQLVTTVSGLIPGELYRVDVVYESKHIGENWNVTVDFDPILKDGSGYVISGTTYGAADETWAGVVPIIAGLQTGNVVSGIYEMTGLVGTIAADLNGEIKVYVDDIQELTDSNHRTWYDGLEVTLIPEPATMTLIGLGALALVRKRK